MVEQEPRYECMLTGEVLKESEMIEVKIVNLETRGISHFNTETEDTFRINNDKVNKEKIRVEILVAKQEPIMVHSVTQVYGVSKLMDELRDNKREMWENLVEKYYEEIN